MSDALPASEETRTLDEAEADIAAHLSPDSEYRNDVGISLQVDCARNLDP